MNQLANDLSVHSSGGLSSHGLEGIESVTLVDSGSNRISTIVLSIGSTSGSTAISIQIPIVDPGVSAGPATGSFDFKFNGLKFTDQPGLDDAIENIVHQIDSSSMTNDEKLAAKQVLVDRAFESVSSTEHATINGLVYTLVLVIVIDSGTIRLAYDR